ncbi:MAG: sigma-70 family RNA polymerase sigma factor, partial [bacterium]|nr:sigma-70 family RNA polymerase sigma factor [bacterium]
MRQLKITKQITNRESVSLSKYLTEVSSIQSGGLSVEEEAEIAYELKNTKDPIREQQLIDKLVLGNLRFVISVAKQYQKSTSKLELGDLINAGNAGMVKAAKRFDETRGFKFISYAVWWIRQSIMQEIADVGDVVRKPLNKIGLYNKVRRIQTDLEQHLERYPTSEEIAAELAMTDDKLGHISAKDIYELFAVNKYAFSVDSYVDATDKDARFIDTMTSTGLEDLEDGMTMTDLRYSLEKHIDRLKDNEKAVIKGFFGIGLTSPKSLAEIGEEIGLTRERCRQLKE